MAWNNVEIKLILKEADPLNISPGLQVDFKINGLWEAERAGFLDKLSYATKDLAANFKRSRALKT